MRNDFVIVRRQKWVRMYRQLSPIIHLLVWTVLICSHRTFGSTDSCSLVCEWRFSWVRPTAQVPLHSFLRKLCDFINTSQINRWLSTTAESPHQCVCPSSTESKHCKGLVVAPHVPRTEGGLYWGYSVRLASCLSTTKTHTLLKIIHIV